MRSAFPPTSLDAASFSFWVHVSFKAPKSANPNIFLLCIFTSLRRNLSMLTSRSDDFDLIGEEGIAILSDSLFDLLRS